MRLSSALKINGFIAIIIAASLVFSAAYASPDAPAAAETTITVDRQSFQQVTAYNQDLGLVKDIRAVNLSAGSNIVKFEDVASLIDPTSVHLRFLDGCCSIVEQNYQYDLVSQQALLQRYLGKDIALTVRLDDEAANNASTATISGKLLSFDGSSFIISDNNGRINVVPASEVALTSFSSLPSELLTRPTLTWRINNEGEAGPRQVEVSYLTRGVSWHANYVAVVNSDDSAIGLNGWITLDNQAGTAFRNATMKFVAGDVNIQSVEPALQDATDEANTSATAAGTGEAAVSESPFFEYHLYSVNATTTIRDKEMKQIRMLDVPEITVDKVYDYDIYPGIGTTDAASVVTSLSLNNTEQGGLGIPLPEGNIRIYKQDLDGQLQFAGEDGIGHTPRNENITLSVGKAFDIVAQTTLVNNTEPTQFSKTSIKSYEVSLRNHKDEAATVRVNLNSLESEWAIEDNNIPYVQKDASSVQFAVNVPEDSARVLRFTIVTHYP